MAPTHSNNRLAQQLCVATCAADKGPASSMAEQYTHVPDNQLSPLFGLQSQAQVQLQGPVAQRQDPQQATVPVVAHSGLEHDCKRKRG